MQNKFIYTLIAASIAATQFLIANEQAGATVNQGLEYESYKNTGRGLNESRSYEQSSLIDLNNQKRDEGQFNYPEVVYEHFKAYQRLPRNNNALNNQQATPIVAGYDFYGQKMAIQAEQVAQQAAALQNAQEQSMQPDIRFLQGYCSLRNEVEIERIAGYATLSCDFMDYGRGLLSVTLTPDFFSQALIATPLYVELNGKKMQVQQGVVLNGLRTSINVATSVNDYMIQKIVAAGAISSATVATRYAQDYLDALKSSRTSQSSNVQSSGGGIVVTQDTNTEKPKAGDYIAGAVVELVSSLASVIGNAYLDKISYSFKINKDTLMFADMQVDFKSKGMRGINYAPSNLIQTDEPRFTGNTSAYSNGSSRSVAKQVPLNPYDGGIQTQQDVNIAPQGYYYQPAPQQYNNVPPYPATPQYGPQQQFYYNNNGQQQQPLYINQGMK
jgi:hypothetical protein